jgi:hypothetical protein
MTSRWCGRALVRLAALLMAGLLLGGCEESGHPDAPGRTSAGAPPGCGPVRAADVVGRRPAYASGPLASFPDDHAACAGLWLPGAGAASGYVPQGLAVAGHIAWVSGFHGARPLGHRFCRLIRVDLRTGELLDELDPVTGPADGGTRSCRHGGGLVLDEHGLWLAEQVRLWLLDPEDLTVRRSWALDDPLQGSFAVHDDRGRLGLGAFRRHGRARLSWLDPDAALASSATRLGAADVVGTLGVPPMAQGAVWGRFGRGRPGVWFATSNTRCGVLVGPGGARRGFLPGAEGLASAGPGRLWAVSESGSRYYQDQGERPVVPMLVRFDTSRFEGWQRADCRP